MVVLVCFLLVEVLWDVDCYTVGQKHVALSEAGQACSRLTDDHRYVFFFFLKPCTVSLWEQKACVVLSRNSLWFLVFFVTLLGALTLYIFAYRGVF